MPSIKSGFALLHARLAVLKAFANRWPAGAPNSKGGQFAPKASGGGAGGKLTAPQYGVGTKGYTPALGAWGGGPLVPSAPPKGAKPHPQMGEDGKPVTVNYPSRPSAADTWTSPSKTATFVPGGKTPDTLNGVAMTSWKAPTDKAGWQKVSGTSKALDAIPFEPHPTKKTGAGVLIVEPDGRVWLTRPTNSFGGYINTFPKGTAEDGLSLQQNAIKEAYEETGLKVKIVGVLGDYERDTSKARFFVAQRVGGTPKDMGWESQAMRLAPMKEALDLLNKPHDKTILSALESEYAALKKAASKGGSWEKQPRWPEGTPVGGQWMTMGADGITMPPKLGSAANPGYDKKAAALHAAAQKGDIKTIKAYIAANADKLAKFEAIKASGGTPNSQTKWAAGSVQYAHKIASDVDAKRKAVASAEKLSGPVKLSSWKQVGAKPGGSNPGAIYEDENGVRWLVKGSNAGNATPQSHNEVLASKLMAAAGVGVPDMKVVDLEGKHGGGIGVASKMIDGLKPMSLSSAAHMASAQGDFAVHAWLANYDAIGMSHDNTKFDATGKAYNIDPGGALEYRAQGKPKTDFTGTVQELKTMRDPQKNSAAASVYGQMTNSQIAESAKKVAAVSDEAITKLVNAYGYGTDAQKAALAQKIISRKNDLLQQVGAMQAGTVAPSAAPVAPTAPAAAPPAASAPTAKPVGAQAQLAQSVTEKVYQNTSDGHSKFWAVSVSGNKLVTRYGKIGSAGATTVKEFASEAQANAEALKLINSKIKGGYSFKEQAEAPPMTLTALGVPAKAEAAQAAASAPAPRASAAEKPASPSFTGVHAAKYQQVASGLLTGDPLAVSMAVTHQGGKLKVTAGGATVTLNNPPKSDDGKNLMKLVNDLKAYHEAKSAPPLAASTTSAKPAAAPKKLGEAPDFVDSVPGAKAKFTSLAGKATGHWQAGNLAVLQDMFDDASNGNSVNSQALASHIHSMMDDLKAQKSATLQAKMAGDDLKPKAVPQQGMSAANMPAMPNFDAGKLPASNTNAASHNKKVDQIKAAALAGDTKALLGMAFSTNTYGSKQAKMVNDALAAMGITEKVKAGQKANTHPALFGGMKAADAADLLVSQGKPIPKPAQAPGTTAVKVDAGKLPAKPEFITSKVDVKKENEHHAEVLLQFAKNGDLANLKAYDKFSQLSQKLTQFKQDLVQELEVQLFPPRAKAGLHKNVPAIKPAKTPGAALSDHATHFPPVKVSQAFNVAAHNKAAAFVLLGRTDAATVKQAFEGGGAWTGMIPQSLKNEHNKHIDTLPKTVRDNIHKYTTNWAFGANDQMRNKGEVTPAIKQVSEAIHAGILPLPEGSQYARALSIKGGALDQIRALQAGDVIQSPQFDSIKQKGGYGEGKNVEFRLVAAAGVKGLWVDDKLSAYKGELEVVMPENARYAVHRVYDKGDKTIIEAIILPTVAGTLK